MLAAAYAFPVIAGMRLGMLVSKAGAVPSGPELETRIRYIVSGIEDGKGTYLSRIVAEVAPRAAYDYDAAIVLLARGNGTAYQALRENSYGPGQAVAADTLEAYVRDQSGPNANRLPSRLLLIDMHAWKHMSDGCGVSLHVTPARRAPRPT